MMTFKWLIFYFVCTYYIDGLPKEGLKFVVTVYRHGDRTPEKPYPTDKYDESHWPLGWGQLTNTGKNQLFKLGKWLRKRYRHFLPVEYNEKDIRVESTAYSRTVMSASCNLAGLYKPVGRDIWNPNLNWQPIPVHRSKFDFHLPILPGKCEKYDVLAEKVFASKEVAPMIDKYGNVAKNLSSHTGLPIGPTDFLTAAYIYYTLSIEEKHGLQLPPWAKEYYPKPLKDFYEFAFIWPYYNTAIKRLSCGPFLKIIFGRIRGKINGSLTEKMWQYSSHEAYLAALMQCLNVYNGHVPKYASAVILELHQKDTEFFVKVLFRENSVLKKLEIPKCGYICSMDQLTRLLEPVIPGDREKECRVRST